MEEENMDQGTENQESQEQGQEQQQQQSSAEQNNQAQTHTIKVNGQERQVTMDEALQLATEAAGAQAKFAEAAEMRKQAERGLRITSLMEAMNDNPSDDDVKELAALLGVDAGEYMEHLNDQDPPQGEPKRGAQKTNPAEVSEESLKAAMQKMLGMPVEDAQAILADSNTQRIQRAKDFIQNEAYNAVEKDAVIGKMIVGDKKDDRLGVIKEMVAEDVIRAIQDGKSFGAELVASSVQKIRAQISRFGIPSKPDVYPISLGLAPGSGLPTEVTSDEPVKRVSAAEDPNEENLVSRYLQKQLKNARR